MNRRRFSARARLPLVAAGLLLLMPPASASAGEPETPAYRSASACTECHAEILRTWRTSQHATAFTDPAFLIPFDRIRRHNPREAVECEQCHNPMRFLLPPGDPRAAIFAQEGVTCEFCHSVESVNPEGPFPRYKARPGVKFGPQGGKRGKTVHMTRFSRLHITSEFCAGCHEYRNAFGVPVLSTYSEWKESFYRGEGVHCQFCHLPQLFDARFIEPKREKGPLDHAMVGGHSRERLAKAIPVRATLRILRKEARVTVQLKNETVGHKTPSGIPLHRIRLAATLYDAAGAPLGRKEEVFERILGDGGGKPLERSEQVFTAAREVLKDNRIGPKESREVAFSFPAGGKAPATAEITLTYELPTPDIAPDLRWIDIPISGTTVAAERGIPTVFVALIALAAVVALFGAAAWMRSRKR